MLDELTLVVGHEALTRLVERFGGTCVYPPYGTDEPGPPPARWRVVIEHVGETAAAALVARFGGTRLYVPLNAAARRAWQEAEVVRLAAEGVSDEEIAERVAVWVKPTANWVAIVRRRTMKATEAVTG